MKTVILASVVLSQTLQVQHVSGAEDSLAARIAAVQAQTHGDVVDVQSKENEGTMQFPNFPNYFSNFPNFPNYFRNW